MKAYPLFLCALCAFVASAAGQSSKLRELIKSDPQFAYVPEVGPVPVAPGPKPSPFSYRFERSFEEWVESDDPRPEDWPTEYLKQVERTIKATALLDGFKWKFNFDRELRLKPSRSKLLRYEAPFWKYRTFYRNVEYSVFEPGQRMLEGVLGWFVR